MTIQMISITELKHTPVNMRKVDKTDDYADILPSIRAFGVLQNIGVRKNCEGYEVAFGGRRFEAAKIVAAEQGQDLELPCKLLDEGDDAAAIEVSMIENLARKTPGPVSQYEAFKKLHKEGRTVADIAVMFNLTEHRVNQRLALGKLPTAILKLYRDDGISEDCLQGLTMASPAQLKEWQKVYREDSYQAATSSWEIKRWLFPKGKVSVNYAIFDLAEYKGGKTTDLFNDDVYLTDTAAYWELQNVAIAKKKEAFEADGWQSVEIMTNGFSQWMYEKCDKAEGGTVYIVVENNGSVEIHEGLIHEQAARKKNKATNSGSEAPATEKKAEISNNVQEYCRLHRHRAVRAELPNHQKMALRLMVASFIKSMDANNGNPQNTDVRESVEGSKASVAFVKARTKVLKRLSPKGKRETVLCRGDFNVMWDNREDIFALLTQLSDEDVMEIASFAMAEYLAPEDREIDILGDLFNVDMSTQWQPDDVFLDNVRSKETLNSFVASAGGKDLAAANITATGKVQRGILKDLFNGTNGRTKVSDWIPEYFKFPMGFMVRRDGLLPEKAKQNHNTLKKKIKVLS